MNNHSLPRRGIAERISYMGPFGVSVLLKRVISFTGKGANENSIGSGKL